MKNLSKLADILMEGPLVLQQGHDSFTCIARLRQDMFTRHPVESYCIYMSENTHNYILRFASWDRMKDVRSNIQNDIDWPIVDTLFISLDYGDEIRSSIARLDEALRSHGIENLEIPSSHHAALRAIMRKTGSIGYDLSFYSYHSRGLNAAFDEVWTLFARARAHSAIVLTDCSEFFSPDLEQHAAFLRDANPI